MRIFGLGNGIRGDDGIGSRIIEILQSETFPVEVTLTDAGSDPFLLLEGLLSPEPVLVIDCAKMGKKPGEVRKIKVINDFPDPDHNSISLHGMSLFEVWKMARSLGGMTNLTLIGVEPVQVDFNTPISIEIENSIPTIIAMVMEEAKKYAEKSIDH